MSKLAPSTRYERLNKSDKSLLMKEFSTCNLVSSRDMKLLDKCEYDAMRMKKATYCRFTAPVPATCGDSECPSAPAAVEDTLAVVLAE